LLLRALLRPLVRAAAFLLVLPDSALVLLLRLLLVKLRLLAPVPAVLALLTECAAHVVAVCDLFAY
jgi:hypothetical protein